MKSFYLDLFEYSHHFNQKLITLIEAHEKGELSKSVEWINHIVNAHTHWNSRIIKTPPETGIWENHNYKDLRQMDNENYLETCRIIESYNLNEKIEYQNTRGESYSNELKEILFHILNHSTHHRAQISSNFRNNNIDPIQMDYIVYKRY